MLNVVVAGRDGTIALKTAGRVPDRVPGSGLTPAAFPSVARSWQDRPEVQDAGYLGVLYQYLGDEAYKKGWHPPLWDGKAGPRIARVAEDWLDG